MLTMVARINTIFSSLSKGFHTYLTTTNLTTNEDIKGAYSNKRNSSNFNPFSQGNALRNCNQVLCSPLNPSLIDAAGYITDDFMAGQLGNPFENAVQNGGGGRPPNMGEGGYPVQPRVPHIGGLNPGVVGQVSTPAVAEVPSSQQSDEAVQASVEQRGITTEQQASAATAAAPSSQDLNQTTMIDSALDLDSLSEESEDVQKKKYDWE